MTDVPPGTYSITLTSTLPSETKTHTFSITFVDPCLSTVPTSQWSNLSSPAPYQISDPALIDTALMTDTVSTSHGDGDGQSFCGTRTYTLLSPFSWAAFDTANGEL